jgi:hypothetical protein
MAFQHIRWEKFPACEDILLKMAWYNKQAPAEKITVSLRWDGEEKLSKLFNSPSKLKLKLEKINR